MLWDVKWGGGQFVAVGDSGAILTSPDGYGWTEQDAGVKAQWHRALWSGTQWLIANKANTDPTIRIAASPDGIHWKAQTIDIPILGSIVDLAWTGRRFVAAGVSGAIATSVDGVHWRHLPGSGDQIVDNSMTRTSMKWEREAMLFTQNEPTGVAGGVCGDRGYVATSTDGVNWSYSAPTSAPLTDAVTVAGGMWLASSLSRGAAILFSMPGSAMWVNASYTGGIEGQLTFAMQRVCNTGTLLVAVGNNPIAGRNDAPASIYTGTVGGPWFGAWSGTAEDLYGLAWNGKVFVAVGGGGYPTIVVSD